MGIGRDKREPAEAAGLRRRAEELLRAKRAKAYPLVEGESQRLIHELQVHQIELEMQNEELIRAREEEVTALDKYTDLYDFAPVGYFTFDRSETIRGVNLIGATLLGIERARLIGRRFDSFIPPEGRASFNTFIKEVYTNQGKDTCEVALRKEGNFPFFVQIEAMAAASGEECRIAVIDITERKELEKQLQQSQKMAAIGTLTGGIAHEFNNIMTAVIGYGSILQLKLADNTELLPKVDALLHSAGRAADLVRSLLTFSRRQGSELKPMDLNELILKEEELLRKVIREDIELIVSPADGLPAVFADSSQIDQVIFNLVNNSQDAMPRGGRIVISTASVEMGRKFCETHGFGEPGRYAVITFSDSGEGMEKETLQKMFEPFFTTKEVGKGTGLGLSICYGIIKQHHGYIICESEPGKGTTFTIYLPISATEAEKSASVANVSLMGGTETILIAEDDKNVREVARDILKECGYRVIEAVDGKDALSKFHDYKEKISLVIMDVIMPRLNGRELYTEISRLSPGMKVIFTSGYMDDVLPEGAKGLNGLPFLSKPFVLRQLLNKVRTVLDGKS